MPITTTLKKTSAFAAAALLAACCLAPNSALAAVDTYNVDLSGTDQFSGHVLRVFGTITLDADLAVGSAISSSSLQFQHESDTPSALPSLPSYSTAANGTNLDWVLDGQDLYITRLTNDSDYISWLAFPSLRVVEFFLGSGSNPHVLGYQDLTNIDIDTSNLKAPSPPDGPLGFKVGTAVPEPSSLALLGLGTLALLRRRR